MARYIDIDSVGIRKVARDVFVVPEYADGWNNAITIFENAPAADVVKEVKCKDCANYKDTGVCAAFQGLSCIENPDTDFCSYGKRK